MRSDSVTSVRPPLTKYCLNIRKVHAQTDVKLLWGYVELTYVKEKRYTAETERKGPAVVPPSVRLPNTPVRARGKIQTLDDQRYEAHHQVRRAAEAEGLLLITINIL